MTPFRQKFRTSQPNSPNPSMFRVPAFLFIASRVTLIFRTSFLYATAFIGSLQSGLAHWPFCILPSSSRLVYWQGSCYALHPSTNHPNTWPPQSSPMSTFQSLILFKWPLINHANHHCSNNQSYRQQAIPLLCNTLSHRPHLTAIPRQHHLPPDRPIRVPEHSNGFVPL